MESIFSAFASLLALFYSLVPNYGVAIVLLTLAVMLATTPLTLKATRSMMVMQQLQPEIKKIQARYKDDRQKLNEELLKFYKENEISPMGGCLPLLIQMPVFIVLYQVLRGLTRRVSDMGGPTGWNAGQLGTGVTPVEFPASYDLSLPFDPTYLDHNSSLYQALQGSTTMDAFGMNLALSASQTLSQSFVTAIPYLLLIVVVGFTGYVQQKQIQGRNQTDPNPQQQMLMKVMPIILPFISFNLPAGLVLYFAFSNLYRVGQQWWISRSLYGIKGGQKGGAGGGKAGGGKSGGKPSGGKSGDKGGPGKGGPAGAKADQDKAKAATAAKATKGAAKDSSTSAKGSDPTGRGARVASRARPPAKADAKKPSDNGKGGSGQPTLQPRARKPKKG